jgi:type VI secretion system secreted protein Hcp
MASDYYLLITGVNGESQAQGMTNNIELDSFSFGASNPPDVGGGGLSGGKCSLSDFSFSCALDSSSFQMLTNL